MAKLQFLLTDRSFLTLLLIVNIIGTMYGYIWYGNQLAETPLIFIPFVPDSPTASLFFVFVLIAFLRKDHWPLMEALALITLFKYGIWAVVMNILTLYVSGYLPWEGYMLIASHFAMALQGLLYSPYYRMKIKHLCIAGLWTLHNDIIDYVFFMYPRYRSLDEYIPQIGYFTFWLSIASIGIAYYFSLRTKRKDLNVI
ncbi:DUF1405 domain-containing protein [Fervidibacillus halotolerans]|uniref:DUF1405 domain-containing protein n=1 Tax=Fervidibacillus halotolerans TaxID=2980027 RepID=A0A9E8M1I7_9BACI|nr:DUF1405 domain-containing protein [Fervidibacillus halotolerans]WAA13750.1 DUF1405 domain-containing protein [Fervidibacillus halotolerans]